MDLTILLSVLGSFLTLALYTTLVCRYFYNLNEKTIKEWRDEHKSQMNEWRDEHKQQIKENELHWRELFMYMSNRIDSSKDTAK